MQRTLLMMAATLLLSAGGSLFGQAIPPVVPDRPTDTKSRAADAMKDKDVTYGRIKELTAGQKVVIDVDNAPDKTFELASKDVSVNLAKGLKVGDPVQVREHEVAGKTKSVTITKHTDKSVTHGDKDAKKR
jgi:hypothetical protein